MAQGYARKRFDMLATEAANEAGEEEARLLGVLMVEEQNAIGYDTDKAVEQFHEAFDRYLGKPYGDETKGRSKITTRELQESMSWIIPDMLDIFASGGRICEIEAEAPEAEIGIEQRADYLNHVFFKDNAGVLILYDFIFDSFLHPRAYADIEWDDRPVYNGWQEYQGLTLAQAQMMVDDEATEIEPESFKSAPVPPSEAFPDGQAYGLRARQLRMDGKCQIEVVPPEDIFVASRSVDICKARYKGRLLRWRRSEWKAKWPELAGEIDGIPADTYSELSADEQRTKRFDDGEGDWANAASHDAEELVGRKEYIWWTPDGQDEEVLLRVYRINALILEYEEVDDDPFASATTHRIPHRLQGLSMPELLGDLQRLKTVMTRALVDATQQANTPRIAARNGSDGSPGVNLNDLLNLDVGAVIRTGDLAPSEALMPIAMPDLTPSTLKALEWTNQIIEQRTGVSRHAQGLDPDSLNHTARGIQLLQNAANGIKRMIARLLAVGVEEMMTKVDRVIMRNQRAPRTVQIGKTWVKVDPRSWSDAMRVEVGVGLGTGSKEAQLGFLQMIQGDQVAWVSQYGLQTPVVTPQHLYHTVTEKLRVMGYKSASAFFGEPVVQDPKTGQQQPFVPQPPPSPDQQKIQAQVQEGQARLQLDQQKAQAQVQLDAAKAQTEAQLREIEANAKAQADTRKAELDAEIARMKAEGELQIAREKAALEAQTRAELQAFEMQMAREKFEFEKQMARENMQLKRDVAESGDGDGAKVSTHRMGGSAAV